MKKYQRINISREVKLMEVTGLIHKFFSEHPKDDYRDLFKKCLHLAPLHLKYSLDKNRPHLLMIHSTEESNFDNTIVQECNGIVFDMRTWKIVVYGTHSLSKIDKLPEFEDKDNNELLVGTPLQISILKTMDAFFYYKQRDRKLEIAEDGSVIKLTWMDDENDWLVSTSKRIDAKRVKWASSKTFYDMFIDCILYNEKVSEIDDVGKFVSEKLETLDKNSTWSFILLHPDNFHVVLHEQPKLIFIGSRNLHTFEMSFISPDFASLPRKYREVYCNENFASGKGLQEFIRGIVVTKENGRKFIYDYPHFTDVSKLRKNMPTISLSYLASNDDEKLVLKKMFPSDLKKFEELDSALFFLSGQCYHLYRNAFINKISRIDQNDPVYIVMKHLHWKYRSKGILIDRNEVYETIKSRDPYLLEYLLKTYCGVSVR